MNICQLCHYSVDLHGHAAGCRNEPMRKRASRVLVSARDIDFILGIIEDKVIINEGDMEEVRGEERREIKSYIKRLGTLEKRLLAAPKGARA